MAKLTPERMDELFPAYDPARYTDAHLFVCVGSWHSYTACDEHALGACWKGRYFIDFMELNGSDELEDVLDTLGYSREQRGELFIQDYESDFFQCRNCDSEDPRGLADLVNDNRDEIENDLAQICAYMEAFGGDLKEALDHYDDYTFYEGMSAEDVAYENAQEDLGNVPEYLQNYIDFAALARDEILSGYWHETSKGTLCY